MRTALAIVLIGTTAAVAACGADAAPKPTAAAQPAATPAIHACGKSSTAPRHYDHVVWIVMENKSYSDLVGGSPDSAFTRSLAASCGAATNFHAEAHPSLPNYIAMTSGSTHGVHDDAAPSSHSLKGPSIFSQLGSRWRALQESMPKPCLRSATTLYAPKHNPAAYYTGITAACSRQDVPLGKSPDLSARFTFITPNLCHDTHNCDVRTGDRYLSTFIPQLVNSSEYKAGRTAIFLTYDEDDGSSSNHIPTLVIAPQVKPGLRASGRFTHYSLLRTTEDMLGLKHLGAARKAPSMRAAFGL
ncbi:MAG TPA: alkaline phosphatase family protein [Thermoleophilaceae bacterium]